MYLKITFLLIIFYTENVEEESCFAVFFFLQTAVCDRLCMNALLTLFENSLSRLGVISRVAKWHPTDEANSVLSIASYLPGLGHRARRPNGHPETRQVKSQQTPPPFTRLQFWTDLLKIYILVCPIHILKGSAGSPSQRVKLIWI